MNTQNNSVQNDHGFIGTGTPYFYPDDGSPTFFLGNPLSCKITSSSEEKVRQSRRREDAGASLDSKSTPKPSEVTFSTDTFQPLTWAMAMMGKAGKVTTTPQTITGETAKAVFDGYEPLAHKDIDETSLVVKKDGATIDKDKYNFNAKMGLLQITDDSVANDGDELTLDYTTNQTTKINIDANRVTSFTGKIVIDGVNDVTGAECLLTIPNVKLAVNGDFDFFSDDFNTIEMKGTASIGKNGEAPYTVELYEE